MVHTYQTRIFYMEKSCLLGTAYQTRSLPAISLGEVAQFGRGRATGNRVTVKSGSRVRISSSPPTPETLLFSRVSCFCQGDFVRRCRTQLRCRTLRCTLRFAKSISLASLLGESLLLRHEMQSCLTRRVAFFLRTSLCLHILTCGEKSINAQHCRIAKAAGDLRSKEMFVASNNLRLLLRQSKKTDIGVFRLSIGF